MECIASDASWFILITVIQQTQQMIACSTGDYINNPKSGCRCFTNAKRRLDIVHGAVSANVPSAQTTAADQELRSQAVEAAQPSPRWENDILESTSRTWKV